MIIMTDEKVKNNKIMNSADKANRMGKAKKSQDRHRVRKLRYRSAIAGGMVLILVVVGTAVLVNVFGKKQRKINNEIPLAVAYANRTEMENDIVELTQMSLLQTDTKGEVVYDQTGVDLNQEYDSEKDMTKITINLKSNLKFSDGEELTADDVIFSYYWLLDEKANRDSAVANMPIEGLNEYKYGSSNSDDILAAAKTELENPTDSTKSLIADKVIAPFLTSQLEWVKTLYGNTKYATLTSQYPQAKDLFAYLYAPKEKYKSSNHDEASVLAEIISEYGCDYGSLGYAYKGDYEYFEEDAQKQAFEIVSQNMDKGNSVSEVSGIKKINSTKVEITVNGYDASYLYDISDIYIIPKHKYASTAEVGDHIDCSTGAGMYTLTNQSDEEASLTANPEYCGEKPLNTNVTLTCGKEQQQDAYALAYNTNAYAYIGVNPNTMNVNGDALSQESCDLRKNILKAFTGEELSDLSGMAGQTGEYAIYIGADGTGNHPAMETIKKAAEKLAAVGIKLNIIDTADENVMWEAVKSGKAQMWCGVWNEKLTPQFTQKYHSSKINGNDASCNPYKLNSPELDAMIEDYNSCTKKEKLPDKSAQIRSKIDSYGIEQSLYHKSKTVYLSPAPKNSDIVFENVNENYDWIHQIGNIQIIE